MQSSTISVYISSTFDNRFIVRQYMNDLETKNIHISHDWSQNKDESGNLTMKVAGIRSATFMIVLLDSSHDSSKYHNLIAELGMAIALDKLIFMYKPDNNQFDINLFKHNNIQTFNTLEELTSFVLDIYV